MSDRLDNATYEPNLRRRLRVLDSHMKIIKERFQLIFKETGAVGAFTLFTADMPQPIVFAHANVATAFGPMAQELEKVRCLHSSKENITTNVSIFSFHSSFTNSLSFLFPSKLYLSLGEYISIVYCT